MRLTGLTDSFNYAIKGLIHALRSQRNMKIHFTIAFLVLLASLFFDISKIELLILFISITLVIATELLNTAIEVVIDMICQEYRLPARIAKNVAAAAVFMAAINAVIVGYLIFFDDLRRLGLFLIKVIKQDPTHVIFITLALLIIIIITLKAIGGRGTPLHGGLVSGHSAISFSLVTIVALLTMDILVTSIVLLLALLIVQSRLENKTHNLVEIVNGAIIGFLLTVIIFKLFLL